MWYKLEGPELPEMSDERLADLRTFIKFLDDNSTHFKFIDFSLSIGGLSSTIVKCGGIEVWKTMISCDYGVLGIGPGVSVLDRGSYGFKTVVDLHALSADNHAYLHRMFLFDLDEVKDPDIVSKYYKLVMSLKNL